MTNLCPTTKYSEDKPIKADKRLLSVVNNFHKSSQPCEKTYSQVRKHPKSPHNLRKTDRQTIIKTLSLICASLTITLCLKACLDTFLHFLRQVYAMFKHMFRSGFSTY